MRRVCSYLVLFLLVVFNNGCFFRRAFEPARAQELAPSAKTSGTLLAGMWLTEYHKQLNSGQCADKTAPTSGTCAGGIAYSDYLKGLRNQYIEAIRIRIDDNYSKFRANVYAGNAVFATGSDWATLGLSGAGAVIGDTELKAILAAASGGVTGAAASYQKEILSQQSAFAIVSGMDAAREAQYGNISKLENEDVSTYTLENGIADLRKYYDAGTLVGGIIYIQGQMQIQAQALQEKTQVNKSGSAGSSAAAPQ